MRARRRRGRFRHSDSKSWRHVLTSIHWNYSTCHNVLMRFDPDDPEDLREGLVSFTSTLPWHSLKTHIYNVRESPSRRRYALTYVFTGGCWR